MPYNITEVTVRFLRCIYDKLCYSIRLTNYRITMNIPRRVCPPELQKHDYQGYVQFHCRDTNIDIIQDYYACRTSKTLTIHTRHSTASAETPMTVVLNEYSRLYNGN